MGLSEHRDLSRLKREKGEKKSSRSATAICYLLFVIFNLLFGFNLLSEIFYLFFEQSDIIALHTLISCSIFAEKYYTQ